jgi:hypothetical protein
VVQRHVLYLSEINSSQELAWRKSIDVLEDGVDRPRTLALFPEDHINLAAALRGKKTVIVVTHRLALVSYCDHLYELKKGRLYPEAVAAHLLNG